MPGKSKHHHKVHSVSFFKCMHQRLILTSEKQQHFWICMDCGKVAKINAQIWKLRKQHD